MHHNVFLGKALYGIRKENAAVGWNLKIVFCMNIIGYKEQHGTGNLITGLHLFCKAKAMD
jgi:hypothetical protein